MQLQRILPIVPLLKRERINDYGGRIEEIHEFCYFSYVLDCEAGVKTSKSKSGSSMGKNGGMAILLVNKGTVRSPYRW